MNKSEICFLKHLRAVLQAETSVDVPELSAIEWEPIFSLARNHHMLPMIYDYVCMLPIVRGLKTQYKENALTQIQCQIIQTNEFLTLILQAKNHGLNPIVLKGIVCRDLYPKPMLRPSVDEDLLIPSAETESYHQFLISEGLFSDDTNVDCDKATELSYHKVNSPTYIELHKTLFDPQSAAYGDFNELFPDLYSHTMRIQIEDVSVLTLEPSYHLLYLILHAFKHFVHSGVGIRPICDIGMFAEHYADEIDWDWVQHSLEKANALYYGKAIFRIIQLYLLPDAAFLEKIVDWDLDKIDVEPLLEDIFASGIHGASSMARLHSSHLTLHAITNHKNESPSSTGVLLHSVFLPLSSMKSRYRYLKKAPFLLPFAWMQRIAGYLSEIHKQQGQNDRTSETIQLGKERIELLKQYHII